MEIPWKSVARIAIKFGLWFLKGKNKKAAQIIEEAKEILDGLGSTESETGDRTGGNKGGTTPTKDLGGTSDYDY